jgi:hypothetical protein
MMIIFELDRRFAIDLVVTELNQKPGDVIPIRRKRKGKAHPARVRSETTSLISENACLTTGGALPIRLGTQMNGPTLQLTVRPNGADHQWREDPSM